jgi:hypothetical protein
LFCSVSPPALFFLQKAIMASGTRAVLTVF